MSISQRTPQWLSYLLIIASLYVVARVDASFGRQSSVTGSVNLQRQQQGPSPAFLLVARGGSSIAAAADLDEEYDDQYDSEDEDVELDPRLAKAAIQSAIKAKQVAKEATKAAVSAKLAPKKKRKSPFSFIPYIIRACMNPFTVVRMTRGYFASFFNLDYLKQDSSKGLRTAQEEQAKRGSGPMNKGKRKMRPGQAKTISDLPKLNA